MIRWYDDTVNNEQLTNTTAKLSIYSGNLVHAKNENEMQISWILMMTRLSLSFIRMWISYQSVPSAMLTTFWYNDSLLSISIEYGILVSVVDNSIT